MSGYLVKSFCMATLFFRGNWTSLICPMRSSMRSSCFLIFFSSNWLAWLLWESEFWTDFSFFSWLKNYSLSSSWASKAKDFWGFLWKPFFSFFRTTLLRLIFLRWMKFFLFSFMAFPS